MGSRVVAAFFLGVFSHCFFQELRGNFFFFHFFMQIIEDVTTDRILVHWLLFLQNQ